MTFHKTGSSRSGQPPLSPLANLRASRERWGGLILAAGLLAVVQVVWGLPMLIVVLAVIGMIFLHEMGHFVAARAAGMKVTEFFLGFGPSLWSVRRGERSTVSGQSPPVPMCGSSG